MKVNTVMILAVIFLCFFEAAAQTPQATKSEDLILENGVAPHAKIDDVYRRFSEAYKKFDAEAVTNLYTDDAFYLSPGSNVKRGRDKIRADFSGYFDSVKKTGGALTVSFQILGRQVSGDLAYDVGIFTVMEKSSKGETRTGRGKFVVVARRMKSDEWLFQVDGYSDLPNASSNNQKQQGESNPTVSQAELQTIRRAIERQYAKLSEALKNKDFEAFQALRTPDFSAVALYGTQTTEQMVARTRLLLSVIQPPIEAGFEILNINARSAENVVVTIRQRFSRMQDIAGKIRPIATAVTQDETWVKMADGEWRLKFVENEKDLLRIIDCKRIEPGKPYDPNAPPYNPPPDPPITEKDWKAFSAQFPLNGCRN